MHPQYNRIFAISIHALRKECDFRPDYSTNADGDISIHALRKECDVEISQTVRRISVISIHALRKECDIAAAASYLLGINDFYPRTP